MATSRPVLFVFLFILALCASSTHCRKISNMHDKTRVQESVNVRVLPRRPVAVSIASQIGHALVMDQKLVADQHKMVSRRSAHAVPSPGSLVPVLVTRLSSVECMVYRPLDRMDARIKQLTDEGVAYDINEVFGEVNAKTKKQRVVGLGSAASSFCIAPSGPSGESSGQSTRQVTEEIQQLKENLNIKDEEIRRLKEEQESMKEQFNEKLAEVFRRLDGTNEC
ncbi:hypothetical protein POM88_034924 [Heracleum sosnowskyi]|uniref:Uncharacterized protein n=1 Tax=Heracleum sosnowskyi TaxID=360622 RepID=A0AAD8HMC5_9APIA|nr:hypothetical protein POM88_034924 [Heracleum sosnowskyi]